MKTLLKLSVVLCVVALAGAGGVWFLYVAPKVAELSAPGARTGESLVEVPPGASTKAVLAILEKAGIVKDARVAYYYVRWRKLGAPKAGEYRILPTASALDVLDKMRKGDVALYEIGFPEGLTYKEIAKRVETTGLIKASELVALCEDQAFLAQQGVPGKTCEGYLFPDTYRVARNRPAREIVALFIAHFHEMYRKHVAPFEASCPLKRAEIVTLASIVEKETGAEIERPHIAGLFLNRVKKGMMLQTDPTVIYAVALAKGSFDGNIHKSDLSLDHPYNTYMRKGLPPGTIANPGLKALEAVVKPTASEDIFFVSKNDGTHAFCPTLECHNAQVQKWQVEYFRNKRRNKK